MGKWGAKATPSKSQSCPTSRLLLLFQTTRTHHPPNPRRCARVQQRARDGQETHGEKGRGALPAGELDDARALGEGDVADAEDGEDAAHGVAAAAGMLLPRTAAGMLLDGGKGWTDGGGRRDGADGGDGFRGIIRALVGARGLPAVGFGVRLAALAEEHSFLVVY